jgi:hypothetical protein
LDTGRKVGERRDNIEKAADTLQVFLMADVREDWLENKRISFILLACSHVQWIVLRLMCAYR